MPTLKELFDNLILSQPVQDWAQGVQERTKHPIEGVTKALQDLVNAPPEELAMQLMGGGVGHISSTTIYKMFPEFEKSLLKNGNDLIPLFHGTSKTINFKELKNSPRGIWLTTDAESASGYAMENDSMNLKYNPDTRVYDKVNSSSRVIPVYADVRNPYILTPEDISSMKYANNYAKMQRELMDKAKSLGHDAVDYGNGVIAVASTKQLKSTLSP